MKKNIKRILITIMFMVFLICGSVIFMYFMDNSKSKGEEDLKSIALEINQGESVLSVAHKLKSKNIIKYPKLFAIHGKIYKKSNNIKFGLHAVKADMTYDEIYDSISRTEMSLEVYNKVTIPEGFTVRQIADRLSKEGVVNKKRFLELAQKGEFEFWFLEDIRVRGNEYKLEGFMYPQTYYFEKGIKEEAVIEKILQEFEKNVVKYKEKYSSKEFYDIIKMASIIERETFIDNEKDIVAGVFYNRLKKGIKLESCATVEYVLNTRKKVLSYEDISIDSPYNTYKVEGLPPTPISNPSSGSIEAAVNPTKTKYMFFVANKKGDGHVFAKTYEQHLENIEKYR